MSKMDDDTQEIVDGLVELQNWFKARGENASSLICTRAAIWIEGTRPEGTGGLSRDEIIDACAYVAERNQNAGGQAIAAYIRSLKRVPQEQNPSA